MEIPRKTRLACMLGLSLLLTACVTSQVTTDFSQVKRPLPIPISVEACIDLTGTTAADLGSQATSAFIEQLEASEEFVVQENADYSLACEVNNYLPGNAFKRWIMPGWGTTVGQVSAMLQDAKTGEIELIVTGDATLGGGGLYTVGAWQYIVPAAVKDTVKQLRAWARGEPDEG